MKPIAQAKVQSTHTNYRHDIATGTHALVADEPVSAGEQHAGPAPYDYLLAALGACTAITLRMDAEKKSWNVGELRVELTLLKNREDETRIERLLSSSAALSDVQWARLLEVAGKTPVIKTIEAGAPISTQRGD